MGQVLQIAKVGIEAVLPKNVMKSVSYNKGILAIGKKKFDVSNKRVFVIGAGKASGEMAVELEKILGNKISLGVVNCKSKVKTKKIELIKAGHPIPNKMSVKGAKYMLALKETYRIGENDIVLCLISGGGSALLTLPAKELTLSDLKKTNKVLLESGANIHEINSIRKHISLVKGGRLAEHFAPATVISLILSDVVGDDLDVIASGPTIGDKSTLKNALKVVKKYGLEKKLPAKVIKHLKKGKETPRRVKAKNFVIGNNDLALKAMQAKAKKLGYNTMVISKLVGETREQAKKVAKIVKKVRKGTAVILGGETTVTIKGKHGKGGRNQEYACATMIELKEMKNWEMASIGTDGNDFMNGIAGGEVNNRSLSKVDSWEVLKALQNHNSYSILKKIGGLVKMKPTGTNVGDVIVYLIK